MNGTPRLYHEDSFLHAFDARVVAHSSWNGAPSVILDRTAFYPESGGQMADKGALAGIPVTDVQEDEAGAIHHVLSGPLPPAGAHVRGEIERRRRLLHMALHTGQHMLSRALLDVARGETVSSRLGETACTIDLGVEKIDERALARAEELCNSIIEDDLEIRAFFPTELELKSLALRREPKVSENVRVVAIGDFDVSPCGGTHCGRTAQVGLLRVTSLERYKGKIRVTFAAGRRAFEELTAHSDVLQALGREFTCGPTDVPSAVDKLRRELTLAREALGHARAELAESSAEELWAKAQATDSTRVVAVFEDVDVPFLRAVAKRITARERSVVLLAATTSEGVKVLCGRGPGSAFDCGAFVMQAALRTGGRGGGKPEGAEGRLPVGVDFAKLVVELCI
ncbi:MAG: alanyl-tRNA editing protein [Deltaproteobacteria bacterium]|nr:alanyl-tRNA editing protein [Deltaproteobacteria bacterium]